MKHKTIERLREIARELNETYLYDDAIADGHLKLAVTEIQRTMLRLEQV